MYQLSIFEIVENEPDQSIVFGEIQENERFVWIAARELKTAIEFARTKGIQVHQCYEIDRTYPETDMADGLDAVVTKKLVIQRDQEATREVSKLL